MKQDVSRYIKTRHSSYHFVGRINGTLIRQSLKTNNFAEAVLRAEQILGLKDPSVVPSSSEKYFIDAVDDYFRTKYSKLNAWRDGYSKGNKCNASDVLTTLRRLQEFGEITCLSEIIFPLLQNFIDDVKLNSLVTGSKTAKRTVSNKTLNKHVTRIKGFLKYCVIMEYIVVNQAEKFDKLPESTPDRTTFTDEQITAILEQDSTYAPFFEFMLETGVRAMPSH